MPTRNIPISNKAGQPEPGESGNRRLITIEYEITNPHAAFYGVTFACGYGGTGTSEAEALNEALCTIRFFKGDDWLKAIQQRFGDGGPENPR